jgi:phage baseplate assembly protein W|tara:strand:- start:332 stop:739 length:408 start_codon:yes stop_codon:yes gene_type:complete
MSSTEVDLNPNKTVGLSLPLRGDNINDFSLTRNAAEQSAFNLKNLLLTTVGERVNQPEFGSQLKALCFEQIDDELPIRIENEVKRAVSRWLNYLQIQSVETLTRDGDKSKIFVKINYTVGQGAPLNTTIGVESNG